MNTVASYAYTLRASGHRSAVAEYSGRTTAYAYDALYRLTRETITADPQLPMGLADYSYDKVGNRLSRTATALGLTQQALSYNANDWLENDTYDSNGNTLASGASGTDSYDFKNRLLRRTLPNGNTIDLHYNAEGHRVRKSLKDAFGYTEQDTHYHTDTRNLTGYAQVLEELTSDGTSLPSVTKRYLYGLDLLAMDAWQSDTPSGGDWHLSYYLYDGHGNVRHLTNQQGQVTDTYTYDAFGILLSRTGTTDNHYRYCGEQWDEDLGMYYLRARYMNTNTGRFWTMDSYEGRNSDPITLHKYLYANANPVMYVDPSGYDSSIAQLNMNVAIFGSLSLMAIPSMRQAITNFGEAARGVAGEIGESAFGYAQQAAGMAAVAAALAYQNFHEQIEKALKDVAQEVKNRLLSLKVVPISKTIMLSIAKHISDVQGGVPQVLTRTDSVTARTNRKSAIAGLGSAGIGMSWDEYPFASTVQGGSGASVRAVPLHENLVQGGVIGVSYRLQNIKFYESFWVIVIP